MLSWQDTGKYREMLAERGFTTALYLYNLGLMFLSGLNLALIGVIVAIYCGHVQQDALARRHHWFCRRPQGPWARVKPDKIILPTADSMPLLFCGFRYYCSCRSQKNNLGEIPCAWRNTQGKETPQNYREPQFTKETGGDVSTQSKRGICCSSTCGHHSISRKPV